MWLHNVSDALIWLAYVAIPVVLVYFARRRRDIPFPWMFWMFGAFIIGCGATHLMEVITSFTPVYRLSGLVKLATAAISLATVVALAPVIPKALRLRSPMKLETEIEERRRAEAARRASEEHFRLLVEGVRDYAIIMLDPQGRVLSWNAGAERIKGYRAEEILGQHFSLFYPGELLEKGWADHVLDLAKRVGRFEDQGWRLRKNGSRFWANVVITAMLDETGRLKGFSKITRDLTEQKQVEETLRASEERTRLIVETAQEAFISMDAAGAITAWNAQAEAIFGWTRQEVSGRNLAETIIPKQHRPAHYRGLELFLSSGRGPVLNRRIEITALHRQGHEFPVEMTISPLRVGDSYVFNAFVHDISERKGAQAKLEGLARRLQESNHELDQFTSIVSHDLQEPLRKIQMFGDRLKTKCADTLGEQGNDYMERMQVCAARMRTFIKDLLILSRVMTKTPSLKPVDLSRVAQEVVSDLEGRIQASGGRVDVPELPTIQADPTQMHQLLQNLVSNSLKFHSEDKPPLVLIEGKLLSGTRFADSAGEVQVCEITVRDNGIGFDEAYGERIFEAFQRLHGREEYEGSGMGLAICRKIVERHGGHIRARSAPGQGATFIVTLPVQQPPLSHTSRLPEERAMGEGANEEKSHEETSQAGHHPNGR